MWDEQNQLDYKIGRDSYDNDSSHQPEEFDTFPTRKDYHRHRVDHEVECGAYLETDAFDYIEEKDQEKLYLQDDENISPKEQRAQYHAGMDRFLNNGILICGVLLLAVLLVAFLV